MNLEIDDRPTTLIRRGIRKMFIQNLFLVLIFCVEVVSPTAIITPGMQRKKIGESCTFQWTIQGFYPSYTVIKLTGTLSANANHSEDRARGIITLTIRNVQLEDAGNYSLSINMGTSTTTDKGALLFVYGNSQSTLTVTSGSNPATEGSSVELACNVVPSSLPAEYRPKLFYFWSVSDIPHLQNFSNGSSNVDLLTGYSFKNDGRSLVVNSVQYQDRQIRCWGQEEGSSFVCCKASPVLTINFRPQVLTRTPANGRFHADISSQVELRLNVDYNPSLTNWVWSLVNTAGIPTSIPTATTQNHVALVFLLPSTSYYGNYTITLTNNIGTTTETFQVLPPVPPETPSQLKVIYATHRQIQVQWNCMAFNGHQQTISVRLNETASNTQIETLNTTVANSCYNSSQTTLFQRKIRPETSYGVSVWSSNALGSSDVVNLVVTTPKKFKFIVSSKTIVFNGTLATINYGTLNGNMTYLTVTCCAESTGISLCRSIDYEKTDPAHPVLFYHLFDDNDVYFFDFTAYGGGSGSNKYYLTMVKGIRVSNTKDDDDGTTTPLLISTAVLAVLLLIAVLALVLLFVLIKRKKHRQDPPILPIIKEEKKPRDLPLPKRPLPTRKPTPSVAQKPPPEDDPEEETYELADAPKPTDDDFYMPLNEKPTRAMRNQYS